ncbi:spore gernimation protein [Paenibacillus hemerocallicola]|uniref:Spore gernimation protein n=1 Tax=Paenibacillus hemerocallicola TaxID=1172614 RepID=A0A5C4T4B8_9BACL|nr:endospore germination permease [Paenibacillus hemerocallicola]TNJ63147.1 spore gernimation protein [Paenibacillus hemerocallicola]
MNEQETVSPRQMGVLFFAYMTGSSIINIPAPLIGKAENGAWLSILMSGGIGMGLLACILYLYRKYPHMSYVDYSRKLIGVWPTAILSVLPLPYMIHMLTGIVLDIGLFMRSSMMRETPVYAFSFPVLLLSALTVRAGIEVMARMFALILLLVIFFIGSVLLFVATDYNPAYLIPVMPDGIKPVLNGAFFTYGFPYAECFLFVMLLPFVRENSTGEVKRSMNAALILNIFTLCISTVCTIMIFGPLAGVKKYSLYEIARTIEVQEIISRIESVIGMSLISGSYMKTTITLYGVSLFVSQLCKLNDHRTIVMPLALIVFLYTLVGFESAQQWVDIISIVHPIWGSVAYVFPLILITVIALFKRKSGGSYR